MTNSQHQSDFDSEEVRTGILWWYTNGVNKGSVKVTGITDEPIQHGSKWHHQIIGSGQVHYVLDTLSEEQQHLLPLWLVLRSVAEDFHLPLYLHKEMNKQEVTTTIFCWMKTILVRGLSYCFIHQKSLVISLLQNWNILAHRLLYWVELFPVYPHQKHPFFCLLNRNSVWLQGRSKLCETLRRTQWFNMDAMRL